MTDAASRADASFALMNECLRCWRCGKMAPPPRAREGVRATPTAAGAADPDAVGERPGATQPSSTGASVAGPGARTKGADPGRHPRTATAGEPAPPPAGPGWYEKGYGHPRTGPRRRPPTPGPPPVRGFSGRAVLRDPRHRRPGRYRRLGGVRTRPPDDARCGGVVRGRDGRARAVPPAGRPRPRRRRGGRPVRPPAAARLLLPRRTADGRRAGGPAVARGRAPGRLRPRRPLRVRPGVLPANGQCPGPDARPAAAPAAGNRYQL